MEEPTVIAMLAGILALMAKEILAYLRSRKNGNPSNPAGCQQQPDPAAIEAKLDRLIACTKDNGEAIAKVGRSLDDVQHSVNRSIQALGDVEEKVRYLEKAERQRD